VIAIRTAVLADIPAVVELWGHAAGPTRHAGQQAEAEALLTRDPDALLVATKDEQIVGTLIVGWDGWRCHMYRLAVLPAERRHGIAAMLMTSAAQRAAGLGAVRIDAMVNKENTGAVAFWESAGFEHDTADGRWSLVLNR
jgi:ribosomal protein S18 acetylase RimI-like enzyme